MPVPERRRHTWRAAPLATQPHSTKYGSRLPPLPLPFRHTKFQSPESDHSFHLSTFARYAASPLVKYILPLASFTTRSSKFAKDVALSAVGLNSRTKLPLLSNSTIR